MHSGKICISISAPTALEMLAAARRAQAEADIIELRFDSLRAGELPLAIAVTREASLLKPVIATFRSTEQGGMRAALSRQERLEFWSDLGDAVWARDLEEDVVAVAKHGTTILSFHDFSGTAGVTEVIERLERADVDILKIAVQADDVADALPVWAALRKPLTDGKQIVPIAMGEAGKWTRILGPAHGAFMTYASLDTGSETAGGQITAHDLTHVYRVKDLGRDTRVYGVVGTPVSSSLSPYMQNAAFAESGENAVFLPLEVKDLDAFMRRMVVPASREVDLNFAGFAVTMPHKLAARRHLTNVDTDAAAIGAVNTVKIDRGTLTGYNTDAHGFIAPLTQRIPDLAGARVAVVGAGGAARAVVYALKQQNADVSVFVRDVKKAASFGDEFNVPIVRWTSDNRPLNADILVNTTPLGMPGPNSEDSPLSSDQLSGVRLVYDLVTRRDDTPLIRYAKAAGVDCLGGMDMLIAQGKKQFEIWTGREAPGDVMRKAVVDRLA